MEVRFYDKVEDSLLKFTVILAKYQGKWVFCKHKERDTYEMPGGHRETGEDILFAAKRELMEETGALDFDINPMCVYSVTGKTRVNEKEDEEVFGMIFTANIKSFEKELHSEMEKNIITNELPDNWTYPLIYPGFLRKRKKEMAYRPDANAIFP